MCSAGFNRRVWYGFALTRHRDDAEDLVQEAALPEDYRVVSALDFMEEFSYQEIAEDRRVSSRDCAVPPASQPTHATESAVAYSRTAGHYRRPQR